jgi:AcrR family transcriptional regulator
MKRSSWAGIPPADEKEARLRIMDAAVRCVQRHGLQKTSIGNIAAEAGVTRPTVYAYFDGRDRVLQAAMLHAARDLAERLAEHVRGFTDPREQVVENLLFCLREFSRYPSLALLLTPGANDLGATSAISKQGMQIARRGLEPLLENCPWLDEEEDEIAELMVRSFLSLLTLAGPKRRTEKEVRALLHRRLVPAIGLEDRGSSTPKPRRRRTA